jgi:pimeloyl-ACP methyl ester carboxylesterase
MVREPLLRVRFLLIAMVARFATGGAVAHPNTTSNIILVHGAWADGSSWSRVIPLLEARGLNVTAVQLPLTSLADDVATTKRAIAHMEAQPGPDCARWTLVRRRRDRRGRQRPKRRRTGIRGGLCP